MAGETDDKGGAGAAGGVAETKDQALGGTPAGADAAAAADAKPGDKPAQALGGDTGKEGDKAGDKKADDKPVGAPEKYEDFKLPEGVNADAAAVDGFKGLAKELNLTQDAAQKLVDFHIKNEAEQAKKIGEFWDKQAADWLGEAKADKEFGGAKFDENVATANLALKTFGTPKLVQALQTYGLGNHPEMIRFMYKAGQAIQNDKLVAGGKAADKSLTAAEALYPSMRAK